MNLENIVKIKIELAKAVEGKKKIELESPCWEGYEQIGTKMWQNDKGTWWMDEKDWVRSKGDYIHREKVDIHFDDSWEYANFIPDSCTFILVPKTNFRLFGWESSLFPIW